MITAVVGAQFGSEGKGKISALIGRVSHLAVRSGGPNAGHSFEGGDGRIHSVRMLPCAAAFPGPRLAIGAGAMIDAAVLRGEIDRYGITPERLTIDPKATVVHEDDRAAEVALTKAISSTGKGGGAALARRILKRGQGAEESLARRDPSLAPYLGDVLRLLEDAVTKGERVVVEGTQGFGLSVYHGDYPYVTSRDTTAAALCSEVGLAPGFLDHVVLVVRTYPIRVAGESGPLPNETTWDAVTAASGSATSIIELTTVTKRVRRVAEFDAGIVRRAMLANRPTVLALMHVDYLDAADRGKTTFEEIGPKSRAWIRRIEADLGMEFGVISTGPGRGETVLREDVLPPSITPLLRDALSPPA